MAGSLNKVQIIGNLGRDPEVRTSNIGKIVTLSVATSETWNDKGSGERKERTEWHRIVVFNERLADVAEKYLSKGRKVYVEGQLETRKYVDKDGTEKYTTEIVLRQYRGELQILDSNREEEPARGGYDRGGRDDRGRDTGDRRGDRDTRGRDDRDRAPARAGGREDEPRGYARGGNGGGREAPREERSYGGNGGGREAPREERGYGGGREAPRAAAAAAPDLDDEIPF